YGTVGGRFSQTLIRWSARALLTRDAGNPPRAARSRKRRAGDADAVMSKPHPTVGRRAALMIPRATPAENAALSVACPAVHITSTPLVFLKAIAALATTSDFPSALGEALPYGCPDRRAKSHRRPPYRTYLRPRRSQPDLSR